VSGSSSLESALHWKEYTSFVSAIDLKAEGESALGGNHNGLCRRIEIIAGSGTITLKGHHGTQDALTVAAGDVKEVQAKEITSVSGVTKVQVFW
jgi:hypothetical protein